jgi:hypothetical protein
MVHRIQAPDQHYACVQNDNRLWLVVDDGHLVELRASDARGQGWLIVGLEDLRAALARVGLELRAYDG